MKRHIESFIEKEWRQTDKSSLRFLNVKTLSVGKVRPHGYQSQMIQRLSSEHTPKLGYCPALTSFKKIGPVSISMWSTHAVLSVARGLRTVCTFWQYAQSLQRADRALWINWARSILHTKNYESNIRMVTENPQYLAQVILDSSVLAKGGLIEIDNAMLLLLESWSRNVCFKLHQKRSEILQDTRYKKLYLKSAFNYNISKNISHQGYFTDKQSERLYKYKNI